MIPNIKAEDGKTPFLTEETGNLNGRSVCKVNYQTSKHWCTVAIIIGSLIVLGTVGFVSISALESNGLISLPKSLSSAIDTVSQGTHFWKLRAIVVGGVGVGGGLVAFGSYKIHLSRNLHKGPGRLAAPQEKVNGRKLMSEEPDCDSELPMIKYHLKTKEYTSTPKVFYHAHNPQSFDSAPIGDYCFIPYKGSYQVLKVKDADKGLCVLVRESTQHPGLFRLVQYDGTKGYYKSLFLFSAAQLAAMTRHAYNPHDGVRVSGLTKLVEPATGLIIFTHEDESKKTYFIVNRLGALQVIPEKELITLINQLYCYLGK